MSRETIEIQNLNRRISRLEERVAQLESQRQMEWQPNEQPQQNVATEPKASVVPPPPPKLVSSPEGAAPMASMASFAKAPQESIKPKNAEPETRSVGSVINEKRMGKTVMSVVAALLVFVGLLYVGRMVHAHTSPVVKICIMYAASAAVAVFGLVKMRKEGSKYNVLYTSLAACGLGSIYITSIVAHFAFDLISATTLLVIIGAWIAYLVVLSRHRNLLFSIICNVGILVATVLSVLNWSSSPIGLIVYFIAISALYAVTNTHEMKRDEWLLVQVPLVCLPILYTYHSSILSLGVMCGIVITALVWQFFYYRIEKSNSVMFTVNNIFSLLVLYICESAIDDRICMANGWQKSPAANIVFAAVVIAMCAYCYCRFKNDGTRKVFYSTYLIAVLTLPFYYYGEFFESYLQFHLVSAVLLLLGALLNRRVFRYFGYLYLCLSLAANPEMLSDTTSASIYFLTIVLMTAWMIRHYSSLEKYIITALCFYGIIMLWILDFLDIYLCFLLCAVVSLLANTRYYSINLNTRKHENDSRIVGYAVNFILLVSCMLLISFAPDDTSLRVYNVIKGTESVGLFVVMAATIGLAFINNRNLLAFGANWRQVASIYIGVKFTLLVFVILHKLDTLSFVMSIAAITLAVLFVIIGFCSRVKTFRLYGLGLSMVGVVKLALFDIEYSSSIMRPIGFFVAGGLCYFISWLYSRLEKQIQ